jgi:hypothetical protein
MQQHKKSYRVRIRVQDTLVYLWVGEDFRVRCAATLSDHFCLLHAEKARAHSSVRNAVPQGT